MTLHRWTDTDGVEWACIAYDHGPLCRNCEQVTDVGHFLLDEHDKGFVDISAGPNGKMVFGLTEAGRSHAQEIFASNPALQAEVDTSILRVMEKHLHDEPNN